MTIDEAIRIKEAYHKKYEKHMLSSERFADRLSIGALKAFKEGRCKPGGMFFQDLPGETLE